MKILVIDDMPRNTASARATLTGHEVTVVDNIKQAYGLLRTFGAKQFDVVLTDLFLPRGDFRGSFNSEYSETAEQSWVDASHPLPAGLVFALAAANVGIRAVICTDTSHHEDWICSLLDMLHPPFNKEEKPGDHKVAYVEARSVPMKSLWDEERKELKPCENPDYDNVVKDWHAAMKRSGIFPELC